MKLTSSLVSGVVIAILGTVSGHADAQDSRAKLNRLKAQATYHCARVDSFSARSRSEKFRAARNRRKYTQRCTAGKRDKNRIFCSSIQRRASRNESSARRLSSSARAASLNCLKYRSLVEQSRRRQRLQYNK